MGQSKSKAQIKSEIDDLALETSFSVEEIKKLYEKFCNISSSIVADGVIDQEEFKQALGLKDTEFSNRIFRIFDENNDHVITFREFVLGLNILCQQGPIDEKVKLSFKVYDIDGDGFIDKNELYIILRASLSESVMLSLTETQMRALVDQTFQETDLNSDGKISLDEYAQMVRKHPAIIKNMTIDHRILTQ